MAQSSLSDGLKIAAGTAAQRVETPEAGPLVKTVMIGGHFEPEVRRALLLIQAEPENMGRTLQEMLGEAINDLCVKYRKPQPYKAR